MKLPKIEYNMACEFIFSMIRLFKEEAFLDYKKMILEKDKDIEEYIKNVNNELSFLIKRDMELLISDFVGGMFGLINASIYADIKTVPELLVYIEQTEPLDLLADILETWDIDLENHEEDKLISIIREQIIGRLDIITKDDEVIREYLKHPKEMQQRLLHIMTYYYEHHFKAEEKRIEDILKQKVLAHQILLEGHTEAFIKNMLFFTSAKEFEESSIRLFVMYFGEFNNIYNVKNGTVYYFYGFSLEQRLNQEYNKVVRKEFLRLLQDDTRYEIIKLLANKKWYGKELADHFELTTATMSYHLTKLTTFGIVIIERGINKRIYYSLDKKEFTSLYTSVLDDIFEEC
ncbi:ArsR family transcriptional regulator [Vallitalea okinawensis]|uniref:ArsR family transcriptional regulator n=1 Tax=Vallitalea okinawensis TaxID=2078660 RepID=UPI000CFB4FB5|nr:ArsR family transcriptional regulator [Vallitalea okinawensis]